MQQSAQGTITRLPLSIQAKPFRYTLYINHEYIGRFGSLVDVMAYLKTESGLIKIQKTNTVTNHHSFTTYTKRGASHA